MARRKLALVNVFFPPQSIGGATRVVSDNFDELLDRHGDEFDLTAFSVDAGRQAPYSLEVHVHKGVRAYRAGTRWRRNMDWHAADSKMGEVFARFLDFEQPDLVHFHCIQRLTGSAVEAVIARGIPFVVTVHDAWWISDFQFLTDREGVVYPEGHPGGLQDNVALPVGVTRSASAARREYLKSLLGKASKVFAVSRSFAEIHRANGIDGMVASPNGLRPVSAPPRKPSADGRVRLAHVGGMSTHKGFHLFRETLESGSWPNLSALVVDLSRPFGHERRETWGDVPVTIVGKYPQCRVNELFAGIDVLVAPSVWPESYGLVTREAAQAGIWVVASDRGGIGDDVNEGVDGNVVDVSGVDGLRACFAAIDAAPAAYVNPLPAAVVRTVSEQVRDLVEHYREILADPRSPSAAGGPERHEGVEATNMGDR